MADGVELGPWPQPPPGPKPSPGTRALAVLRILHRRGWLRPRRIGCLVLVLVLLFFAALWVVGSAINATVAVFDPPSPPVSGSPFDTVAPTGSPSSGSSTIDRITRRKHLTVAVREAPGLAEGSYSSKYSGFDIDLLELIAHELGVDPTLTEFKEVPAGNLEIPGGGLEGMLNRKEVDLALGGYEITPERLELVEIAGPYLENPDYGFGLPPGDEVFRERINGVLSKAIEDGIWAKLYDEHIGTTAPRPPDIE